MDLTHKCDEHERWPRVTLSLHCSCGAYLEGLANVLEADQLIQEFASVHSGPGHCPCNSPMPLKTLVLVPSEN